MATQKEFPEMLSIEVDRSQLKSSPTITNILFSNKLPDTYDRLTTLILPEIPCAERDQVLGAYLAAWNKIEAVNDSIITSLLNFEMWDAAPITTLGLNVSAFNDLISGLAEQSETEAQAETINKYLIGYKVRNTKRNRIVHGKWLCRLQIGAKEDRIPYILDHKWLRTYTPSSSVDRAKLAQSDPKAIGKFSFTIKEIQNATKEITTFVTDSRNSLKDLIVRQRSKLA